jgi:cytochrome c
MHFELGSVTVRTGLPAVAGVVAGVLAFAWAGAPAAGPAVSEETEQTARVHLLTPRREGRLAGDAVRGEVIYKKYCATCHGESGKGDGPAAAILHPRPRDHTNGAYMSTVPDEQLARIIREGGAALGRSPLMPAAKSLSKEAIDDLIAHIRSIAR